jgi:guanine deaminase
MSQEQIQKFMSRAIELSRQNLTLMHGGPFGAVVVKDGRIVGQGRNQVILTNDPTAHAEITAIRDACKNLGSYSLEGCDIYSSCEPCPMCLGAVYWSRPARLFFACTRDDAELIGFDDKFFYREMDKPEPERSIPTVRLMRDKALAVFHEWNKIAGKPLY